MYSNLLNKLNKANLPNRKLICTAICISLSGSFHFGYQVFITNPGKQTFVTFVNASLHDLNIDFISAENLWGIIVSLFFIGAIFGSILIKLIGDKMSNKNGFLLASIIMISAINLSIISKFFNSVILFSIARFFIGVGTNLLIGLAAVFLTECSPREWRSSINMITGIFAQIGCVMGTIVSMQQIFSSQNIWWLIYAVEIIPMLPLLIWLFFMYDSPMYFARKNDYENAQKSLLFYQGKCGSDLNNNNNINNNNPEILLAIKNSARRIGMFEIFKNKSTLIGCLIGLVASIVVAFSGIVVLNVYATDMLINNGLTHFQASITQIIQMLATVFASILSSYLVKIYSERTILLFSNAGILIFNILIVVFLIICQLYQSIIASWLIVATLVPLNIVFVMGVLPLSFFIATICVEEPARLAAQSWAIFGQMLSRALIVAIYLPTKSVIGEPLAYFIFFVVTTASAQLFFYRTLPKRKNDSNNQI